MATTKKKIKINGVIVSDSNAMIYRWLGMEFTSPGMVSKALEEAAGEQVEVLINSGGGSYHAGSEIFTILKDYSGDTVGKITGLAGSAASVAAMGVKKLCISPTAQIMIHNSTIGSQGDRHIHSQRAGLLLSTDEAATNAYMIKTGKSREELLELMDKETYLNAQKALEHGFADEIMFSSDETINVSNSASESFELPQVVINKVRSELVKMNMPSNLGIEMKEPETAPVGAKGEDTTMDLEELKAKHPELYAQVLNQGMSRERNRIVELNALAGAPGASQIVAKAIEDGRAAGEAALDIVKASKERLTKEGADRLADSENSGIRQVTPDEAPATPDTDAVCQAEADEIGKEIKNLMGGKK
ncbi:head maturation protease, ClpP-related [Desulfitobacterium chlororespirans]|uniref:ATP-dependent Clp protease proteolytic subunit n=1 Tax=Desulfitobacterium chlororespirans DSM 11544 TaxID=1121395 RepID=A0A1M7U315_9FIRM|nr:head maturation protease, ClpP-related [Desulfitobacterium chlororespirans]SHN77313.1 ATP-dependent protease ClpP, protease subunit [Desulfitobacterium chlororespirans DSM 11544]